MRRVLYVFVAACAGPTGLHERTSMLADLDRADREATHEAALGDVLDRDALVTAVLAHNPDLAAARATWRADVAAATSATALPDPTATYELAPLSIGSDVRFGERVAIAQKLPWSGKRALAGEASLADADAARADYAAMRVELAEAAIDAFDDDYVAARALEVNAHHRDLLERIEKSAIAQYTVGKASEQDPIEARGEIIALDRERLMLDTAQREAVARINRLLHRVADAELPPPPPQLELPARPSSRTDEHPKLVAAHARIHARTADVERARRDFYPDVELMASYDSMWDTWQHRWMIGVGFDIPIQRDKRRADVDRANAEVAKAEAELASTTDALAEARDRAHRELDESLAALHLYETEMLPNARTRVDAALAGFTANQNPFSTVVMAEHALRGVELDIERMRADVDRRTAAVDRAEGRLPGGGR